MLKFVKGSLENVDGAAVYAIISLVICFVFFVTLLWWVFSVKKTYTKTLSELPLNDGIDNTKTN